MYIILIIAVVILLAIVRPTLLAAIINGLRNIVSEIWSYLAPIIPYYILGTLIAIGAIAAFIILGVAINVPVVTGICFSLSIVLFYLVFLVPGLFFRLIRVNQTVFPPAIKTAAAWLAVLGFLGMFSPEALSFDLLLGVGFLAFIALGIATKTDFLTKVAYPLVLAMCFIVVWKFVAPENFRAATRHFYAKNAQVNSWNDRKSIEAEADALVTYARPNRHISVVYIATMEKDEDGIEYISGMKEKEDFSINENTLIKVYNHKGNVMQYEGQGFVMVQIAKKNGSFVNSGKYWLEADYLTILSPGDLAEERRIAAEQKQRAATIAQPQVQFQPTASTKPTVYEAVGTYTIAAANQESGWVTVANCRHFNFTHYNFEIVYKDGTSKKVWEEKSLPSIATFKVINRSNEPVGLLVKA